MVIGWFGLVVSCGVVFFSVGSRGLFLGVITFPVISGTSSCSSVR